MSEFEACGKRGHWDFFNDCLMCEIDRLRSELERVTKERNTHEAGSIRNAGIAARQVEIAAEAEARLAKMEAVVEAAKEFLDKHRIATASSGTFMAIEKIIYAVGALAKMDAVVESIKSPEMMERLAEIEHDRWSRWMKYLFENCETKVYQGGEFTKSEIPHWARERWVRQMNTSYANLSEEEKESNRAEVRKTLAALSQPGGCEACAKIPRRKCPACDVKEST